MVIVHLLFKYILQNLSRSYFTPNHKKKQMTQVITNNMMQITYTDNKLLLQTNCSIYYTWLHFISLIHFMHSTNYK